MDAMFLSVSMEDILSEYSEPELMVKAESCKMKGYETKSKEQLVDELSQYMLQPEVMENYFSCLKDMEIEAFEAAISITGVYTENGNGAFANLENSGYMMRLNDGGIMIPANVKSGYQELNTPEFQALRRMRSYIVSCMEMSRRIHGIIPLNDFVKMVNTGGFNLTKPELLDEFVKIPDDFKQFVVDLDNDLLCYMGLYPDDHGLRDAQGDIPYYIPTYEEILEMAAAGGFVSCEELLDIIDYFITNLGAPEAAATYAARIMQNKIGGGCEMKDVFEVMNKFKIAAQSQSQMQSLAYRIQALWNNTRMLINKGHTPAEKMEMGYN